MTQYFNNISSFAELKSQYKALALANHPDRGGDTATMQAINAEYDRLYVIWVNRESVQVTEGVWIVDYSDRAFAVVGNTKPLRTVLKSLGGRFNGGLTIDGVRRAGWVFSRNRYTKEVLAKEIGL